MTGEHWRVVKTIAADALDLPDDARAAFVSARCGGDEALRREVVSLLASVGQATNLYETPMMTAAGLTAVLAEVDSAAGSFVGRRVGAYRLVAEIGRGGMGTAYLGERADEAFTRQVAVKLIKRGMDTDAILQRFYHERQILASLNHPNIATLLDGGTTDDGLPYFIMEYIDGQPIDAYCDGKQLSIRDRLELFLAVCAAVQHAHDNRIVHRDLKPANVLVTRNGVPKLLDFGIAKLLDPERGLQTEDGSALARVMTPEYASPEQIRGEPVTAATDVYALGILLYVLLTGRNPQSVAGGSRLEVERRICEVVPVLPSMTVDPDSRTLNGARADAVRGAIAGDLDAIVLTAMEKAPERRYTSVKAFADDIQCHLDGRAVAAHIEPPADVYTRWLTRGRMLGAAAAFVVVIALIVLRYGPANPGRAATAQLGSIAVLPVSTGGGGGEEVEFLAQGITESLIRRLSRLSQLKVIARDSVYRYTSQDVDARRAGRELHVDAVLKGRLTERRGTFVLYAELINTNDGTVLWGERYERPVADVQFLQAELAQQITNRLRLRVSSHDEARIARSETSNAEAYQLYLRGRYFWNRRTTQDFRKAIMYFTQAVQRDASFALAYAGLADAHSLLTEYHGVAARESYAAAKDAASRALALDDGLAEAHASMAYIRQFYEWDFAAAEMEFQRAIELDPTYATGHQWYAEFLSAMGRHDDAMAAIRRAVEADPLSLIVNSVEVHILYLARRYEAAIKASRRVLEMDPNFPEVYEYLKRAFDQRGAYKESVEARQARRRLLGLDASITPALRLAADATDSRTYWKHRLEQERLEARNEGLLAFEMAEIEAQAGEVDGAIGWLERACADSDFMVMTIRVAPNLDPLRADPRFQALLGRSCRVGSY